MGLSGEEILSISKNLAQGEIPKKILEEIARNYDKISPKKEERPSYWGQDIHLELSEGFKGVVDAKSILNRYKKEFEEAHHKNLGEILNGDDDEAKLADLFEIYASLRRM